MKKTVRTVVEAHLCMMCGACAGVCPVGAIEMRETPGGFLRPFIDGKLCILCGLCFEVCPGKGFSDSTMGNGSRAGKDPNIEKDSEIKENPTVGRYIDPFTGPVIKTYRGICTDDEQLIKSQSGGIVTALLLHTLESGMVDAVVVTGMARDGSLRPLTHITSDPDVIDSCRGSKYCPVGLGAILREIKEMNGKVGEGEQEAGKKLNMKIGIVGVGCQIQGIRNAMRQVRGLDERIAFTIGLFCDRTLGYGAIDHLVNRAGLSGQTITVTDFEYRSKKWHGWPGDVLVGDSTGKRVNLESVERMRVKDIFTPPRCRLCHDKLNALADISIGDSHGMPTDKCGASAVVVRNAIGEELLAGAADAGRISVEEVDENLIFKGQAVEKRRPACSSFRKSWEEIGLSLPEDEVDAIWEAPPDPALAVSCRQHLELGIFLDDVESPEEAGKVTRERIALLPRKPRTGAIKRLAKIPIGFFRARVLSRIRPAKGKDEK